MNFDNYINQEINYLEHQEIVLEEHKKMYSDIIPEVEIKYEQAIDSLISLRKSLEDIKEVMEE